jgi:hypothetical protein
MEIGSEAQVRSSSNDPYYFSRLDLERPHAAVTDATIEATLRAGGVVVVGVRLRRRHPVTRYFQVGLYSLADDAEPDGENRRDEDDDQGVLNRARATVAVSVPSQELKPIDEVGHAAQPPDEVAYRQHGHAGQEPEASLLA